MDGGGDFGTLLGGGGITGIVILGARWIIGFFFEKQKENLALKAKNDAHLETRLEDTVKNFRSAVDTINANLNSHSTVLRSTINRIDAFDTRLVETEKALNSYTKQVDTVIANKIKTEAVAIAKQLILIRNKKNGV